MFTRLLNLSHSQHILGVDEILEDDTYYYCEMRVADGGELFLLAHEVDVVESECKRIMFELLKSMSDFHRSGFVHRDVKPENVLSRRARCRCPPPAADLPSTSSTNRILRESSKATKLPADQRTVKLVDFDTCVENLPQSPTVRHCGVCTRISLKG